LRDILVKATFALRQLLGNRAQQNLQSNLTTISLLLLRCGSDMSVPPSYIAWANDKKEGKEHVLLPNFVRKFRFTDKDTRIIFEKVAEPISGTCFQKNLEESFWAGYTLKVNTKITTKQTATAVQKSGAKLAEWEYQRYAAHLDEDTLSEQYEDDPDDCVSDKENGNDNGLVSAGQKHARDPSGELGETSSKIARYACEYILKQQGTGSEAPPLQSPTPSEPGSPVRPFTLLGGNDEESLPTSILTQHHEDDPSTFFTSPTEHQRRESLLQALHDGKQLNINRPDYTFNLPLDERDWGPRMTRIYD
ncbi:hypothetical protein BGX34_006191, partial [Mortierella sp. NVP85]